MVEGKRYIVNVEAFVWHEGRYLMIVRGDGVPSVAGILTPPGGKVELDPQPEVNEVLEATLEREVMEEVGVEVYGDVQYLESHLFELEGTPVVDVVMLARYRSGEARRAAEDEVAEVLWLTYEEIVEDERAMPWTRRSLEKAEQVRRERRW